MSVHFPLFFAFLLSAGLVHAQKDLRRDQRFFQNRAADYQTWLADNALRVADWLASSHRVTQLSDAFDRLEERLGPVGRGTTIRIDASPDARIILRDGKVFIRKWCAEHGKFEALFFGDAELYVKIAPYNKPGTIPLKFATEVHEGCPLDCGLCPDHQQHACLALIEVNNACNLHCPLCFAAAGTNYAHNGFELTY